MMGTRPYDESGNGRDESDESEDESDDSSDDESDAADECAMDVDGSDDSAMDWDGTESSVDSEDPCRVPNGPSRWTSTIRRVCGRRR